MAREQGRTQLVRCASRLAQFFSWNDRRECPLRCRGCAGHSWYEPPHAPHMSHVTASLTSVSKSFERQPAWLSPQISSAVKTVEKNIMRQRKSDGRTVDSNKSSCANTATTARNRETSEQVRTSSTTWDLQLSPSPPWPGVTTSRCAVDT